MAASTTLRSALAVFLVGTSSCAAATEDPDDALVGTAQAALSSSSSPKGQHLLYARATYDAARGVTMVDVATTALQQQPTDPDPHNDDEFIVAMVYVDRSTGRDVLRVLAREDFTGANQIGPGGGCIHFSVPANVGDRLAIGGVVRVAGDSRARVAVAPVTTVVGGVWSPPSDL